MLDTKTKRLFFIVMIFGIPVILYSFWSWKKEAYYNKIYYTKNHYEWRLISEETPENTKTERQWSLSATCIQPHLSDYLALLEKKLDDHLKNEVSDPWKSFTDGKNRDPYLLEKNSFIYRDWLIQKANLEASVKMTRQRLEKAYFNLGPVREGELLGRNYFGANGIFKNDNPPEENIKIRIRLHFAIDQALDQKYNIVEKCMIEEKVYYAYKNTTRHSDILNWPKSSPWAFYTGLLLIFSGILGSFGYNFSIFVYIHSIGAVVNWIKNGKSSP